MMKISALALAAVTMMPGLALAHTGAEGHTHGAVSGFLHPVGGMDHVLAMVLVGMLAWQIGQRALWLVPGAFVAVMAAGGALGMAGIELPALEAGIALSVVVLGAMVALGVRAPVAVAMGLAGLFALFHGQAHGAEMPASASALGYAAGFMVSTALLHAAGVAAGYGMGRISAPAVRMAGAAASVAGVVLLVGAV